MTLAKGSKVNHDLRYLSIVTVSLTICSKCNDFDSTFIEVSIFSHKNVVANKFDLVMKWVNVNLGSSFEQARKDAHSKCYISKSNVFGFMVPEKNMLKNMYMAATLVT